MKPLIQRFFANVVLQICTFSFNCASKEKMSTSQINHSKTQTIKLYLFCSCQNYSFHIKPWSDSCQVSLHCPLLVFSQELHLSLKLSWDFITLSGRNKSVIFRYRGKHHTAKSQFHISFIQSSVYIIKHPVAVFENTAKKTQQYVWKNTQMSKHSQIYYCQLNKCIK